MSTPHQFSIKFLNYIKIRILSSSLHGFQILVPVVFEINVKAAINFPYLPIAYGKAATIFFSSARNIL